MTSFRRDQRGVAMVTVLLVGAALTVMATTASFLAVRDLRSGTSSSNGIKALGYAEAGLQRFLRELKLGSYGLGSVLTAGCSTAPVALPEGRIGDGTYSAQLTVFDAATTPQVPPTWTGTTTTTGPCGTTRFTPPGPSPKEPWTYAITATGRSGSATRVIRSIVTISSSGLPVGVFVNKVNANGNPGFGNISLFANSDVYGREKMTFTGTDLQYTIDDVYGNGNTAQIPAAVHTTGAIFMKANGKNTKLHPPSPNCSASQSLWDGSGLGTDILSPPGPPCPTGAYPPTAKFTQQRFKLLSGGRTNLPQLYESEYAALKAAAQTTGVYCSYSGAALTPSCTYYIPGTQSRATYTVPPGTITSNPVPSSYVAYFDFPPGGDPTAAARTVKWTAPVFPCSDVPATNRNVVIVVRNGSAEFRSANTLYGNVVAPEGAVDVAGGFTIIGSVLTNDLRIRGNATFKLDACGQRNSPSAAMDVTGGRWSEVDR